LSMRVDIMIARLRIHTVEHKQGQAEQPQKS
jgi:hypothetical protein